MKSGSLSSLPSLGSSSNQLKTPRSAERMLNRSGNTSCALSALRIWETTAFATIAGSSVEFFRLKAFINFAIRCVRACAGRTVLRVCVSEVSKKPITG
jgi:hypothetical protein